MARSGTICTPGGTLEAASAFHIQTVRHGYVSELEEGKELGEPCRVTANLQRAHLMTGEQRISVYLVKINIVKVHVTNFLKLFLKLFYFFLKKSFFI